LFDAALMSRMVVTRSLFIGKQDGLKELGGSDSSASWSSAQFEHVNAQFKYFTESKLYLDDVIREVGKRAIDHFENRDKIAKDNGQSLPAKRMVQFI
jgi:hypothetical protein